MSIRVDIRIRRTSVFYRVGWVIVNVMVSFRVTIKFVYRFCFSPWLALGLRYRKM